MIDFKCNKDNVVVVVKMIEYDLNCFVNIVLVYYEDGVKVYILVLKGLEVGMCLVFGLEVDIKVGNVLLLENILVGIVIYNIEMKFGKGG